jgi:tetratricopeptide (TPR) repeat protein
MAHRKRSIGSVLYWIVLFIGFSSPLNSPAHPAANGQEIPVEQAEKQTAAEWIKFGDERKAAGNPEQAINAYKEAIHLNPTCESAYLQLAWLLGASGRQDEQIAALYSAGQVIPDSTEVFHALSNALIQTKRYEEVIQVNKKHLILHPNDADALGAIGRIYIELGQYDNSIAPLEKAIEIDDKQTWILLLLSNSYLRMGRNEKALDVIQKALDLNLEYPLRDTAWASKILLLQRLGRTFDAANEIEEELASHPQNARALEMRAVAHMEGNRTEDAFADWKRALELQSIPVLRGAIYYEMGFAYLQTSRHSDAIEMFTKSLELIPDDERSKELLFICLKLMVTTYSSSSRCEEAMDSFERAIRIKTDDAELYNNISRCLAKSEHSRDAEKALRYAIQLNPNGMEPRYNLGLVLLHQNRLTEAESEFRTNIKMGDANWRTYFLLGSILLSQKNPKEATQVLRQALRLRPDDPLIMNNLGYTLLELNESLPEALNLLERTVKAAPSNPAYRDSLGWAYFKSGKLMEAEKELLQASRGIPKSASVLEHLGDLYQKMGRKTDAISLWKNSLSLAVEEEMKNRLRSKIESK